MAAYSKSCPLRGRRIKSGVIKMKYILTVLTLCFMVSVMPVSLASNPWRGDTLKANLIAQTQAENPEPQPSDPPDSSC